MSQEFNYTAPVFIGDTIPAEAEVPKAHATNPFTKFEMTITCRTGETVSEGEAW